MSNKGALCECHISMHGHSSMLNSVCWVIAGAPGFEAVPVVMGPMARYSASISHFINVIHNILYIGPLKTWN